MYRLQAQKLSKYAWLQNNDVTSFVYCASLGTKQERGFIWRRNKTDKNHLEVARLRDHMARAGAICISAAAKRCV